MNNRLKTKYERLLSKKYYDLRSDKEYDFSKEFAEKKLNNYYRVALRFKYLAEAEQAILFSEDRIGWMRTIKRIFPVYTSEEMDEIRKTQFEFDLGVTVNIASNYEETLNLGFEPKRVEIAKKLEIGGLNEEEKLFYETCLITIDAVYLLVEKYQKKAIEIGNKELASALAQVPKRGARNFYEALVCFRILNYMLWLNGGKHNTIGRFDQYMYPFFEKDLKSGVLSEAEALELIEELFIDLNTDADLYEGVQQGDNGQSMVLGGCDKEGNDAYNALSELCLRASLELSLIDPKINLRVNKNTPSQIYKLGTLLTKQGLGFPQYSNDDVVIPALVDLGYDLEDARNYVVAACWEFIIPGLGLDIPNIDALNFAGISERIIRENLLKVSSINELEETMNVAICKEVDRMASRVKNMFTQPSPLQSLLMTDCVRLGKDIKNCAKYNNLGFHGVGIANAADSFAAVQKVVFDDEIISKERLLAALENDFIGYEKERNLLLDAPKMGNNEDYVDDYAVRFLNVFADACKKHKNEKGGCIRAGTGTAMYYIWYAAELNATADGRKKGTPLAANYSPSLNVPLNGALSVIQSFTKPNLHRVCNGGPLTLEFHDTVFRNDEGLEKVAKLVELYVQLGGHQLQLNAVNRERLLDAQAHPENHRNLIVRVWGWSGYFNELDLVYQNHVIQRLEFLGE